MRSSVIVWFRRDQRLGDHPGVAAAVGSGQPAIALFIPGDTSQAMGAAVNWRLGQSHAALARSGCARLPLDPGARGGAWPPVAWGPRGGRGCGLLDALLRTGACRPRPFGQKHASGAGIRAESFGGALSAEPRNLRNASGQPYAVFAPFGRCWRSIDMGGPAPCGPMGTFAGRSKVRRCSLRSLFAKLRPTTWGRGEGWTR